MLQVSRSKIISFSCFTLAAGITVHSFMAGQSTITPDVNKNTETLENDISSLSLVADKNKSTISLPVAIVESAEKQSTVVNDKGDTVMSILSSIGMTREQAHLAVNALRKVYNPKALNVGQALHVIYKEADKSEGASLISVNFKTATGSDIALRYKDGEFVAEKILYSTHKSSKESERKD